MHRRLGAMLAGMIAGTRRPSSRRDRRQSRQAGLTLLEALLSVGIIGTGLAVISSLQINQLRFEKAAVAAQQHRIVHYSARRYVRDHLGELIALSRASGGVTEITSSDLATGGYVPDFMLINGALRSSPFGQEYRVVARYAGTENDPSQMELYTMARGGDLSLTEAGRIVSISGAEAGTISFDGTRLTGAYGSWETPIAVFPAEFQPQPGELVMLAFFREGIGGYVNSYAANIPTMHDRHEALPETPVDRASREARQAAQSVWESFGSRN